MSRPASFVNAATVAMPLPPAALAPQSAGVKPTLQGTTASVAGPPSRRRELLLIGVVVAALAAGAAGTALMLRRPARATHASVGPLVAPAAATLVPIGPAASIPPLDDTTAAGPSTPRALLGPRAPAPPSAPIHANAKTAAAPTSSAKPLAGAAPSSPAAAAPAPPPSAAPAPPPSAASTPAIASTPTPASTSTAEEGPEADPTFDAERAYVEVGMINAEGVKERAVRGALHGLGLSQCYKSALRAHGARSTGVATLNLSFDETGLARSAILTGADFLPDLARCVQAMASGMRIGRPQVEGAGGVAEVTLGFREP